MKTNSIKHKITKLFVFIIGAVFLSSIFGFQAKAANILLPEGSNVEDVAVNSLNGYIYYTTTQGTLKRLNSIEEIPLPLQKIDPGEECQIEVKKGGGKTLILRGNYAYITSYEKFMRITVDVKGVLWAVIGGSKSRDCLSERGLIGPVLPYLFFRDGSNWTEVGNSKSPSDVGSSAATSLQSPSIFVAPTGSIEEVYFTTKARPGIFGTLGKKDFSVIDGGKDIYSAWAIANDRKLWSYFANVIDPAKRWTQKNQDRVVDVSVNKKTGRIYIIKHVLGELGQVWFSDDGTIFTNTGERGFKNISVHSNGTVYVAGILGSLESF